MQFSSKMLGLLLGVVLLSGSGCTAPTENSSEMEQQVKAPLLVKEIDQIAEKITVRIESSDPGSGVIVAKEKGFFNKTYYVLTVKHAIEQTEFSVFTPDGKEYKLHRSDATAIPNADLALVKFTSNQDYAVATLSNYDFDNKNTWDTKTNFSALAFVSGFPNTKQEVVFSAGRRLLTAGFLSEKTDYFCSRCREGFVEENDKYALAYDYGYSNITYRGMSGSPILNSSGQVMGIHGRNAGETVERGRLIILGRSSGTSVTNFLKSEPAKAVKLKIESLAPLPLAEKVSISRFFPFNRSQCKDTVDCLNYVNELRRIGNEQDALIVLAEKVLSKEEGSHTAWYLQGRILTALKRGEAGMQRALESYEYTLKLKPDYYPAWYSKCDTLREMKRLEAALQCLDDLSKQQPKSFGVWHSRGENLYDLGRYKEAVASYDRVIEILPNVSSYNNRGAIRPMLGDTTGAIDDLTKAIQLNPNFAPPYHNRGMIFHSTGDCKRAVADLSEFLRIGSGKKEIYLSNLIRGLCFDKLGNRKAAIQDFEAAMKSAMAYGNKDSVEIAAKKLLEIDSNNATVYYNRAEVRSRSGDYLNAVKDYSKAVQIDPNYADAFGNRGLVKLRNLNDIEGAIKDFNQVIVINPKEPRSYLYRGQARLLLSKIYRSTGEDILSSPSEFMEMLNDFQTVIQLLGLRRDKRVESDARLMFEGNQKFFSQFSPEPNIKKVQATLTELQQSLDKLDSK